MDAALVSIIIPTYNRASYIGAALNSIMAQSYTHWECLVVDDGSKDNTEEIMHAICEQDSRISYYKRSKDYPKGVNGARNFGIANSKGSYIAFCDDDDFWLPEKLEKQIPIFKAHPEVGLVTGNIEYVNADGVRTGRIIAQRGNHGYVFEDLLFKNRLSMITPVIRRSVIDKVGLFNTNFTLSEDWEYWRRVAYYYPFYALPDVLACVRKHNANTSLIVTNAPFEQYVLYRKLTTALLAWGEGIFTKADRQLIAKVEAKRYRQIFRNHCPGVRNKLGLIIQVFKNDWKDGVRFCLKILKV
ncbi:Glycosyltransferase involved in cell wall bisynthesis [Bizionia echini]|uniref:Glycosyltransferase involved in cell wall bisynthesis n=1 Tax=Bizionia echini TaxID=649333 RepID=A0A1I5BC33_9FLAO|nr:glycosyltransferase family 2 protein [Bizionia echini]SFN72256.1 Glycosyltransferase involved in cell wall bisynthesis [Bizionia echini]